MLQLGKVPFETKHYFSTKCFGKPSQSITFSLCSTVALKFKVGNLRLAVYCIHHRRHFNPCIIRESRFPQLCLLPICLYTEGNCIWANSVSRFLWHTHACHAYSTVKVQTPPPISREMLFKDIYIITSCLIQEFRVRTCSTPS